MTKKTELTIKKQQPSSIFAQVFIGVFIAVLLQTDITIAQFNHQL